MKFTPGQTVHGFAVKSAERLPEINGEATVLVHEASKAKLLYLGNDDNNKAFSIGFRTPPKDDTGVFHILEHSVLCGSDKYPVKEPFVDLLKGSMQTFLNALTFPDKTMYPVASTNEQDLFNLMDVYLDAVLHPSIYRKRTVFEQEGWHYELVPIDEAAGASAPDVAALPADRTRLVYNGVVFNEMKGALSDSSAVLFDELQKALFPDGSYAFESGGTPEGIPALTYENYLDEHRRHYRLDNSYALLYGNLDIDRALAWLDERYSARAAEEAQRAGERAAAGLEPLEPRTLASQPPVKTLGVVRPMDTAPENACAGAAYVIGAAHEHERVMAADILVDALCGSNEAPLKRALLDDDIADDVTFSLADSMQQPFVVAEMRMPRNDGAARLCALIAKHVADLADRGIDRTLIEASLAHAEFTLREHNYGIADGVVYAMASLAGWLYDDDDATTYLRYEEEFADLREKLASGWFDAFARALFVDNEHVASVDVRPEPGRAGSEAQAALDAKCARLTPEERRAIIDEEATLRAMQEAPDTPEAKATLPRLHRSDIGDAPEEPPYGIDWRTPLTCLRHRIPTHGIAYAYRYYDVDRLTFADLPYASVLSLVLGKLPTRHHTAAEIDTLIQGKLGNLDFFFDLFENRDDIAFVDPKFVVSASALSPNSAELATLVNEILLESDFSDHARIEDILTQRKIDLEQNFIGNGHVCATTRARSYYAAAGVVHEQLDNVGLYLFLKELLAHFDERASELSARLEAVAAAVFNDNLCTVSFAGSENDYDAFWLAKPQFERKTDRPRQLIVPAPRARNEAFIIPSNVCFAAMGTDRRLLKLPYTGAHALVGRILSFDYLWNEVRVKGGAYGVGFTSTRNGNMRFYSYRDPHLDETIERFARAGSWLASFDPAPEDEEGFVVSTVAGFDAPVKARQLMRRQDGEFFSHHAPRERAELRAQALASSVDDVRALSDAVSATSRARCVCAFGSEEILSNSKAGLAVTPLFG